MNVVQAFVDYVRKGIITQRIRELDQAPYSKVNQ
jgi:hypothetical protein